MRQREQFALKQRNTDDVIFYRVSRSEACSCTEKQYP